MAKRVFFITGTDTAVGKTLITAALLHKYNQAGFATTVLKPVASGCKQTAGILHNDDALILQKAASYCLDYPQVNPIALADAVSPHIAAARQGIKIELTTLLEACRPTLALPADFLLIEGVGGWFAPLSKTLTQADMAQAFTCPVILVVGLRLGCLNHSLLTYKAIVASGLQVAGWIANVVDPSMQCIEENIATLKSYLPTAYLGYVPYQKEVQAKAIIDLLDFPALGV